MPSRLTDEPFQEALPRLLKERGLSLRGLAAELGVNPSHLSRGRRRRDSKRLSGELVAKATDFFGLPRGYFPEEREAVVIERVRADPAVRDDLYSRLQPPAGRERDEEVRSDA